MVEAEEELVSFSVALCSAFLPVNISMSSCSSSSTTRRFLFGEADMASRRKGRPGRSVVWDAGEHGGFMYTCWPASPAARQAGQ